MCTDAYREALTRDLSSTASSAPAPAPAPSQRQAAEVGREGAVGRPLRHRRNPEWQSLLTDRAINRFAEEVCVAGVAGRLLDEVQQHPPEREVPPVTQRPDR